MSQMDFMSALQGGGAPPDVGGPPAALGGEDLDTGGMEEPEEGQEFSTSLEALDAAEDALHAFIQLDPDEADRAEATKALQVVIKLKASNQDSANAGDLSSLQRALQGGPAATGGALAGGGF